MVAGDFVVRSATEATKETEAVGYRAIGARLRLHRLPGLHGGARHATPLQPFYDRSGLPSLTRYTCPLRGPLAQLGERRLCTAGPGRESPLMT